MYFKYFEICIESGNAVQQRLNQASADIFFIDIKSNDRYKEEALENLLLAKKRIENEIDYIDPEKNKNSYIGHFHGRWVALEVFKKNIDQLLGKITGKLNDQSEFVVPRGELEYIPDPEREYYEYHNMLRSVIDDPNNSEKNSRYCIQKKLSEHVEKKEELDDILKKMEAIERGK